MPPNRTLRDPGEDSSHAMQSSAIAFRFSERRRDAGMGFGQSCHNRGLAGEPSTSQVLDVQSMRHGPTSGNLVINICFTPRYFNLTIPNSRLFQYATRLHGRHVQISSSQQWVRQRRTSADQISEGGAQVPPKNTTFSASDTHKVTEALTSRPLALTQSFCEALRSPQVPNPLTDV